jgi:hypothetical protein
MLTKRGKFKKKKIKLICMSLFLLTVILFLVDLGLVLFIFIRSKEEIFVHKIKFLRSQRLFLLSNSRESSTIEGIEEIGPSEFLIERTSETPSRVSLITKFRSLLKQIPVAKRPALGGKTLKEKFSILLSHIRSENVQINTEISGEKNLVKRFGNLLAERPPSRTNDALYNELQSLVKKFEGIKETIAAPIGMSHIEKTRDDETEKRIFLRKFLTLLEKKD